MRLKLQYVTGLSALITFTTAIGTGAKLISSLMKNYLSTGLIFNMLKDVTVVAT